MRDYDWTELSQAKWALRRLLGDLGALGVDAPILWISERITHENVARVRNSGHSGLLPRNADTVTAVCALRAVLNGDRYFPERYSRPSTPEAKADAESKRIIKLLTPYGYEDLNESKS